MSGANGNGEFTPEQESRFRKLEIEIDFCVRYMRIIAEAMGLRTQAAALENERATKLQGLEISEVVTVPDSEQPTLPGE